MNDANAKADALVKDAKGRSETLVKSYEKQIAAKEKELETSEAARNFLTTIRPYKTVTLLYASKEPVRNHARILQQFLEAHLR